MFSFRVTSETRAKGGKGGAPGGGGKGPSPKVQLSQLVNKLDVLAGQSLHVDLNADQKKQAKELLAGLAEKDEISDEDAKAKLDALLKLLEPNKKVMEDAPMPALSLSVPLQVDARAAHNWDEAH